LVPVIAPGPVAPRGTPILRDGAEVGTMRSGAGRRGLAQIRLDAIGSALTCDGIALAVEIPSWMRLPEPA
jgi:hypothetical protein